MNTIRPIAITLLMTLGLSASVFAPKYAAAAGAITLTATVKDDGAGKDVVLHWNGLAGYTQYLVSRDWNRINKDVKPTSFTDLNVPPGSHVYWIQGIGASWKITTKSNAVPITITPPPPPAPSVPKGLTATPEWTNSCPKTGMAMGHIVVNWKSVSAATSYNIYRGGTLLQSGVARPPFTDMGITSGQSYTYAVSASGPGGQGAKTGAVTAVAPDPPATPAASLLPPPTNVRVHGTWQGTSTDTVSWSPVPGAVAYNVYEYGYLIGQNVTATSYMVPNSLFCNSLTYTVTAIDEMGMETIPSQLANAQGAGNPAIPPHWIPSNPTAPTEVTATPDWNAGAPRVHLTWVGSGRNFTYNVYRNGQEVASGLWGLSYFDDGVAPGETYIYTVTSENFHWLTPVESAPSAAAAATALSAAPAVSSDKVQITSVLPDDDSVLVSFNAVPGAADYRIFDVTKPDSPKYAGWFGTGQTGDMIKHGTPPLAPPSVMSIELNGINPATGADLVVEAVDKLGPFQCMDGAMGPGSMTMSGAGRTATNGQGDPSNLPNVIARSDVFHVTCRPRTLTGAQAFFDNFRGSAPLVPMLHLDSPIANESSDFYENTGVENDKWQILSYSADTFMTHAFFMGNHFMDTLYDGPTAAKMAFSHNNNATLVMKPKATADISGGKVLHVTFEVDAHFDGRRWCDLFVGEAGDPLTHPTPTKLGTTFLPTVTGNLFAWSIEADNHKVQLFSPSPSPDGLPAVSTDLMLAKELDYLTVNRSIQVMEFKHRPYANGAALNLDKRSRFDLYLSQSHYRIVETMPDGVTQITREREFPAGVKLPFTKCQVYFAHELYHTGNDRPEQLAEPGSAYWYNYRPWCDERHWDNMGFEVLPSFP